MTEDQEQEKRTERGDQMNDLVNEMETLADDVDCLSSMVHKINHNAERILQERRTFLGDEKAYTYDVEVGRTDPSTDCHLPHVTYLGLPPDPVHDHVHEPVRA